MDLRLKFDEDAGNYDALRPTYTKPLFDDIIAYSELNESKRALEIGIGTGQATLPILDTGCGVTAVELGENLAGYVEQKFAAFAGFRVIHTSFESFAGVEGTYDLIYAATAFHWLEQDSGLRKIHSLLKPGGSIALFWNHPFVGRDEDELHQEIRRIYLKYRPSDRIPVAFSADQCRKYEEALESHEFSDIVSKIYDSTRILTGQQYILLLNTYSDHRALPEKIKPRLEGEIASAIDQHGGKLRIYDTMDLYLARKL